MGNVQTPMPIIGLLVLKPKLALLKAELTVVLDHGKASEPSQGVRRQGYGKDGRGDQQIAIGPWRANESEVKVMMVCMFLGAELFVPVRRAFTGR